MSNRVVIQEGYSLPFAGFDGYRRRKAKRSGSRTRQASKMKKCALKWRRSRKTGKYTSFMKKCLKGR